MADKDKKGSLNISRGENSDADRAGKLFRGTEEASAADKETRDGPDFQYGGAVKASSAGAEPSPGKPAGKPGGPSREQLLANLERMRAQLGGGPASIDPAALLGRGPAMQRPGLPGGPGLPALNPAAAASVVPTHGSDAAGPGMGGYHPDPYAVSKLGQGADKEFSRIQQERAQITPKAPTDDILYQEMLKLYGGG